MSDNRDDRPNDTSATPADPAATSASWAATSSGTVQPAPQASGAAPDAALNGTPAAPHEQAAFVPRASQTQPTIPLIAPTHAPANPYGTPVSSAQAGHAAPAGAAVRVQPAYAVGTHPAMPAEPAAQPSAPHVHTPGGHTTHPRYGAAFGADAATAAPAYAEGVAAPTAFTAPAVPRKRSGAGKVVATLVAAALVGGAAGLGSSALGNALWGGSGSTVASGPQTVTINNPDKVSAVTAVAAAVTPSVVTISASTAQSGGSGSGVVLSEDGYILTNTHVVTLDGASGEATLRVTTSDGKIYNATLVGTDPLYDLAVIKLEDASGLTPIEFADSSKLNVGDQAIAIGAPLGLDNTVTTGIVSALNRSIQIASSAAPEDTTDQTPEGEDGQGQGPFQFDLPGQDQTTTSTGSISIAVIQTDAAINPGNSGGALVDAEGKLIGINVAIASAGSSSEQSGNIGVGFSIPSNIAERVSQEIIENGSASHGLLGATVVSAEALEDSTLDGAVIQEVSAGGAAEEAGLQAGDVVTRFNGLPISSSIDLTAQVRALAAGDEAEIQFVRDGKTETVTATLGEYAG